MDTGQYLDAFLAETEENLNSLNELCLTLEKSGADDSTFAAVFRTAHTLKGMSATMGYAKMADLTHHMEDALTYLREHPGSFEPQVVDILFACLDALTDNLEVLRRAGDESAVSHESVIEQLRTIGESTQPISASSVSGSALSSEMLETLAMMQEGGQSIVVLQVKLEDACIMKGVRMVMVMRAIEAYGDCVATTPDAPVLEQGDFSGTAYLAVIPAESNADEIIQAIQGITEVESVSEYNWEAEQSANTSASTAPDSHTSAEPSTEVASTKTPQASTAATPSRPREQTLRVPVSRIDDFMNVLSELVIAKTRLELLSKESEDSRFQEVSDQIARLSDGLQDGIMSMRMMPVDSLFQRFPRMMRDLEKSLNREFDFEMAGLETEMDRTVMDEMGEALVHLLRNAADHGLETPEEREQGGKPRRGTIQLSAYAAGGHVYLEVADDGGGIHREKVLQKAIERGIVQPTHGDSMTDEQVYDFLFASGFSTAQAVSDISGRGVGLDAVRGKVESLGGTIRIESEVGKGTTFYIELPLTLTILQAILVRVNHQVFAIPTSNIEEVNQVAIDEFEYVHEQMVYRYQNHVVPVVDLGDYFFSKPTSASSLRNVAICKSGKRLVALVVDDVIDELEVVNKPLGAYLGSVEMFSGATILGNGHVALIVDVNQIL